MVGQVDPVDRQVQILGQAEVENAQTQRIPLAFRHHLPQQSSLGFGLTALGVGESFDVVKDMVQNAHLFEGREFFVELEPHVALELLVAGPEDIHIQQGVGRLVNPQRSFQCTLCARIEPIAQTVVHKRAVQAFDEFVHAPLVLFALGMGFSGLEQCG